MHTQPVSGAPAADEDRLKRARRRLAALKGLYVHLFIFTVVLTGLGVINLAVGRPWWVLWVLLGWGIGMLAHGLTVLGQGSHAIADWEERKLRQYLNEH